MTTSDCKPQRPRMGRAAKPTTKKLAVRLVVVGQFQSSSPAISHFTIFYARPLLTKTPCNSKG